MEQQVFQQLTKNEQALLASVKEMEVYKVILKAGAFYQQEKAAHVALVADSYDNVILNRGNIYGARFIADLVKYAAKSQKKA